MKTILIILLLMNVSTAMASEKGAILLSSIQQMWQVLGTLPKRLEGIKDPLPRSVAMKQIVRSEIVDKLKTDISAELVVSAFAFAHLEEGGSDAELYYDYIFSETLRRLVENGSEAAKSELLKIQAQLRLDGRYALLVREALDDIGAKK